MLDAYFKEELEKLISNHIAEVVNDEVAIKTDDLIKRFREVEELKDTVDDAAEVLQKLRDEIDTILIGL